MFHLISLFQLNLLLRMYIQAYSPVNIRTLLEGCQKVMLALIFLFLYLLEEKETLQFCGLFLPRQVLVIKEAGIIYTVSLPALTLSTLLIQYA